MKKMSIFLIFIAFSIIFFILLKAIKSTNMKAKIEVFWIIFVMVILLIIWLVVSRAF